MRLAVLISLIFFLLSTKPVFAQSAYVLPYPSSMPGSSFYLVHQVIEKALRYWYFGDFGRFKYNLKYSDKYLVEAKTLFEYKQYLLAYSALEKSNYHYSKIPQNLAEAKKSNKNISEKENMLLEASRRHTEVLEQIKQDTPKEFVWSPEKGNPTNLSIHELIDLSINIRKSVL